MNTTELDPESTTRATNTADTAGRMLSSPIVAALEATWAAIQARHPEIPDVVLVLASGSIGVPRGSLRLGHFAAMRWYQSGTENRLPEVFVGGEGLARGPVDVLGTLLHEATHALAHVRGVQDCSRQGRYHNRRFQALAAELGLRVEQVPVIGWSDTHVPEQTTAAYAVQVAELAEALVIHRYAEGGATTTGDGDDSSEGSDGQGDGDETVGKPSNVCRCACPRRITVAPTILALGSISCRVCDEDFAPTA